MNVIVAGAGAFGGWTALELQKRGASVTLVDMAGAGNPLSSSGGESRVIRHVYDKRLYVDMATRALELWKQADRDWGLGLFHQRGVLFMSNGGTFIHHARAQLDAAGIEYEWLDPGQLRERFPQINPQQLDAAIFERGAGYIDARRSCMAVRDAFLAAGGSWRSGKVVPGEPHGSGLRSVKLHDGDVLHADQFVFACGPWLKSLFPDVLGRRLHVSRQEVYFFEAPKAFREAGLKSLPVWADVGKAFWYGIPAPEGLFKIADDTHGVEVDPDTQSREATEAGVEAARAYMEFRFPGMAGARLTDHRVCQYSLTPDHDFILDRLPGTDNAWLIGGGSGHGFKHGPAIGEMAANAVLGACEPPADFGVKRW